MWKQALIPGCWEREEFDGEEGRYRYNGAGEKGKCGGPGCQGEGKVGLLGDIGAIPSVAALTGAENGEVASVEGLKGVGMSNGEPAGSSSLFLAGGRRIGF